MQVNSLKIKLLSGQDPQVTVSGNWFSGPVLAIHVNFLSGNTPEVQRSCQWIVLSLFLFLVSGAPFDLISTQC